MHARTVAAIVVTTENAASVLVPDMDMVVLAQSIVVCHSGC